VEKRLSLQVGWKRIDGDDCRDSPGKESQPGFPFRSLAAAPTVACPKSGIARNTTAMMLSAIQKNKEKHLSHYKQ